MTGSAVRPEGCAAPGLSWFETREAALLTMRNKERSTTQNIRPAFISCAFKPRVECWFATLKNSKGTRTMSAASSISGKGDAENTETYDVVVVGAGFAGMY